MARHRLQLLLREGVWQVYFQRHLIARMHTDRIANRRDYLVYQVDGQWARLLVEHIDATYLPTATLVKLFIAALISREIHVTAWHHYPRCRFVVTDNAVDLLSNGRVVYSSKKPLNEFQFRDVSQGHRASSKGMSRLSEQLRQDYRNHLVVAGQPNDPHRREAVHGRGYSFQNHSLYLRSLHLSGGQVIAKLYDRVPQYSHLHGLLIGRFMRRPFLYAVTFRDVPGKVLETRIRRTFEEHYGLSFSQKNLEVEYVALRGEVTPGGDLLLRTERTQVLAASAGGMRLTRRVMRDSLYVGGEYLGLHISHYPGVREIVADHMAALAHASRQNRIIPLVAFETLEELDAAQVSSAAEAAEESPVLTREVPLGQATQYQVHDHGCTLATDNLVTRLTRRLTNKALTLFPYLHQIRLLIPR